MDEVFIILPQGKQQQNTAKKEKRKDQRSGRRKKLCSLPLLTPQMLCNNQSV
jgi:hypothetical protein